MSLSASAHRGMIERWKRAGAVWTDDLRLRDPIFVTSIEQAKELEVDGVLACINTLSFETFINLSYIKKRGVTPWLDVFMAHEIGHHIIAPAGFANQMRLLAAAARASYSEHAPMYVNLALDLLINDQLVRLHNMPCDRIYAQLTREDEVTEGAFGVMLGAMEQLWGCNDLLNRRSPGPLCANYDELVDALVATYSMHGEGRRSGELLPYVTLATRIFALAQSRTGHAYTKPMDGGWDRLSTGSQGAGQMSEEELRRWLREGGLSSLTSAAAEADRLLGRNIGRLHKGYATGRHPAYAPKLAGEMLNGLGLGQVMRIEDMVISYYEELSNAYLLTFMGTTGGKSAGYPESLKEWTWGDPMEEIDWLQSAIRSGQPIPGINTVAWEYGYEPEPWGADPFPVDLDLYIDTSGSMPDPRNSMSHIALGGFIFALSVLRQGGAVRVTIWSWDMQQLHSTHHFSTSRQDVLEALCISIQGGTQFPVEHWERAVEAHKDRSNIVHTVILSDDGIDTWFRGTYELERVERALAAVQREFKGGGTVILNGRVESLKYALPEDWVVRASYSWEDVVDVCGEVARRRFGPRERGAQQ